MRTRIRILNGAVGVAIMLALTTSSAGADTTAGGQAAVPVRPAAPVAGLEEFAIPKRPEVADEGKIRLGRRLFHDPILSRDGTISCASCHDLANGGADGRARSFGVTGKPTRRNSPSVYNLAGQVAYFRDGRAASLEVQIDDIVRNPDELGAGWDLIVSRLEGDFSYRDAFRAIYGAGPSARLVKDALVAFQGSLVTSDSPFDRYLAGAADALTAEQRAGLGLFRSLGCSACHHGPMVGGVLYQKLGIFNPFHAAGDADGPADTGRYEHTGDPADILVFKVPSLRNVALTAPYFHDGSVATLDEAEQLMAYLQLGTSLENGQVESLVAFLESLSSEKLAEGARRRGP